MMNFHSDLKGFHKGWLHLYNEGAEDLSGNPCDESGSTNDGGIKTTTYWFKRHDAKKGRPQEDVPGEWKFEMKIPLVSGKGHPMGVLYLVRDLRENPLSPHTVRRVESLRRSMCVAIEKLQNGREVPKGREEAAVKKKRVGAFLTRFLS